MTSEAIKVSLAATVRRGFGRGAHYTASLGGLVNATAPTLAEVKVKLAEEIAAYVNSAAMEPAFGVDDDGSIIVAIPQGGGVTVYRGGPAGFRPTSSCSGTPDEVIARCPHYTPTGPSAAVARADTQANVAAAWKIAEGWVGFEDSHPYGDAILLALSGAATPPSSNGA